MDRSPAWKSRSRPNPFWSVQIFRSNQIVVKVFSVFVAMVPLLRAGAQKSDTHVDSAKPLELVRAARPWEFVSALGERSALLGKESGEFEAWVYPLKILRNFHLRIKVDGEIIEAKDLVRSIAVHPESTTLTYAWDTFSIQETLFAPVDEAGAIIQIEADTTQPIEIQAVFDRDFQLEWPGTMGGSDIEWNPLLHAFYMDETQHRFTALIGSPTATRSHTEFSSNYATSMENSFDLGLSPIGRSSKLIVIAASFSSLPPADVTYRKLAATSNELLAESAAHYQKYLDSHVTLDIPDKALESAYQWAQVSVLQGLVDNPYLGKGLVAGFKTSSQDDQRPGYAWFFGRDALWTSFALNAEGDYETTRTAIEFLSRYQRKDGKITHEIAQGASFVPWFDSMPYAYASADATPLYIIAMADYVQHSGDTSFAAAKWTNLQLAHRFIVSTYDSNGVPKNEGIGHGWVEGGPLLPVKNELYQASVASEALHSFAQLAHLLGKEDQFRQLSAAFEESKTHLNLAFWMNQSSRYAFALDSKDQQVDSPSVLATVPMWFGLFAKDKAESMIRQIDGPEMQTSWGMRIIGENNPKYDAAGYHSGTVWPLFTGWASVGEYRYHEAQPAYDNLRSNALLTFDGSLGHVAEVLSGSYYQTLSSGSPHQVWSSAMVISPLLKGLFGLDEDAFSNRITLDPHVPADWTYFNIKHVTAGSCQLNFKYSKTIDRLKLDVEREAGTHCVVDFSPALNLRTTVLKTELDGHKTPFQTESNNLDDHVHVHLEIDDPLHSATTHSIVISLKNDFGLSNKFELPQLGNSNDGIRILSQEWNAERDELSLQVASASIGVYELAVWNPTEIKQVDGASLIQGAVQQMARLRINIPAAGADKYHRQTVRIRFSPRSTR